MVADERAVRRRRSHPRRPRVMRRHPRGCRRSVDRGTGELGIEPRNVYGPGRRRCREKRKATRRAPPWRGARRPCAVRDPTHAGTPSAREPGDPWAAWQECARPRREGFGRTPLMHGPGKSDPPIVPGKRPNRPGRGPGAEAVEGRGGAEGTAGRQSTVRTLSRDAVSQALARVREAAKRNKRERFTALMHHITPDLLAWAFQLEPKAAPGVDG